jgi:hypothetical protein
MEYLGTSLGKLILTNADLMLEGFISSDQVCPVGLN